LNKNPRELEQDTDPKGEEIFLKFATEIFDEFGISNDLAKEIKNKKKLLNYYIQYCKTGDVNILNSINFYKKKLTEGVKEGTNSKFSDEVGALIKATGVIINPKKMSIFEYYTLRNGN